MKLFNVGTLFIQGKEHYKKRHPNDSFKFVFTRTGVKSFHFSTYNRITGECIERFETILEKDDSLEVYFH